jgi:hypothetical protein
MDFMPSHRLQSRLVHHPHQPVTASSQAIPVFVAVKRRRGLRHYVRCVFQGVHDPEGTRQQPYLWTHGEAVLECHFPSPTKLNYVWLEVARTSPHGAVVDVSVNHQLLVHQQGVLGGSTIRFHLPEPRLVTSVAIGIRSTTFVPATTYSNSTDRRELGIALQAVVFGKRSTKYRSGTVCRTPFRQRVARVIDRLWSRKAA